MKIPALALIIILYFSGMVSAVPDSVITGPYAISFDLGLLHSSYEAVVTPPVNTELLDGTKVTEYVITINNNTAPFGAKITLSHIENAQPVATGSELQKTLYNLWSKEEYAKNVVSATRKIDGVSGGIVSFDYYLGNIYGFVKSYEVQYNPAFDNQHLLCTISSTYSWDEGTLQLLKTIHVERVT